MFVYSIYILLIVFFFFFQAEDGIRDGRVTGVQTCALPISCTTRTSSRGGPPASRGGSSGSPRAPPRRVARVASRRYGRGPGLPPPRAPAPRAATPAPARRGARGRRGSRAARRASGGVARVGGL